MRLTEARIRSIVRGVIRESINDRAPVFPPGSQARLETLLKALAPRIREEILESDLPAVRSYMEMATDPNLLNNEEEADQQLDRARDLLIYEMAESPTPAVKTAALFIVNTVWSKWLDGQGADENDADALVELDHLQTMIVQIVSQFMPEPKGRERYIHKTIEGWIGSLPDIWTNQVVMARMKSGMTWQDAQT